MRFLLIALGGAIGAVLRYLLSGWVQTLGGTRFPWGTLAVNVVGSILLAYLIAVQLGTPIVIEVVDRADRIDALIPMLDQMIQEGMVTIERVVILKYLAEPKQ